MELAGALIRANYYLVYKKQSNNYVMLLIRDEHTEKSLLVPLSICLNKTQQAFT